MPDGGIDGVVGFREVAQGEQEALNRLAIEQVEDVIEPLAEPALHLTNQGRSARAEFVYDAAAVFGVRHAFDKVEARQAVHYPGECGGRDAEPLGEFAGGELRLGTEDEHDAELGEGEAEGGPFFEAARVGAGDEAPEEMEDLFLQFFARLHNSCHDCKFPGLAKYSTSGDTILDVSGEFESVTENAALKQRVIDRIRERGGISFRDFMETVLYEPGLGYYTGGREVIGREGDYLTSPEVSPVFGAMVGRQSREMWQAMGRPERFDIVECGAGNGTLARDILSWAQRTAPEFYASLGYWIVEISEALRERQKVVMESADTSGKVAWAEAVPEGTVGCILSNELLDAMPVHRVAVEGGKLREVYVSWDGTRFCEELREPSSEITGYFDALGLLPGEGCRAEVNLGAVDWMRDAAGSLAAGFMVTFDYGYEAEELYASWRADGTLLGFYRHNPSADPYARIGRQDLTSHVDFTSVRRAGEATGLATLGLVTQSEFLAGLGITEALKRAPEGDLEELFARRRAVMELLDPGGLGRIKVLVQAKGGFTLEPGVLRPKT